MFITAIILIAFALAPVAMLATRAGAARAVALIPAGLFAALATLLPEISAGGEVLERHAWIPTLGISIGFRADGLSLLMALLISGIGSAVFFYAADYLAGHADQPRFFLYLTLFMAAMLGAVLADDLMTMVVFWELTSLTSFMLIGFEAEKPQSRRSAQQGLLITVAGGLSLLAGVILIGVVTGTFHTSQIAASSTLANHELTPTIIVLVALGAFAKSAQVPLHVWLPNAMVAPTPVSAYLHSATMVKLGVYLLARLNPAFAVHDLWTKLLIAVGMATMLTGAVLTLREKDLKRILAYSTIVSLGLLVTLIGMQHQLAALAMILFLLAHALYKACLFLVAGIIDHEAGTRDVLELSGLRRRMPITAAVALAAGISMAGVPPFIGFISKELVYEAYLETTSPRLISTIALLANASMVVAAGLIAVRCFWGQEVKTPRHAHDPAFPMLAGPVALAVIGLVLGIMPGLMSGLVHSAVRSIYGEPVEFKLALWHGWTPMLGWSIATVTLGILVLLLWGPMRRWLASRNAIDLYGPNAAYDRAMIVLPWLATWQTNLIQSGSLRSYLSATLSTAAVAMGATLLLRSGLDLPTIDFSEISPVVVLALLLIVAAIFVVRARSFMAGIIAAGMVGFSVSLLFLFQGAPDLAFTQFSVEGLTIVILLAIVGRMPFRERDYRTTSQRWRDAVVAAVFGTVAAMVLLSVVAGPFDDRLSRYFAETSYPEAHGRNIVNVIIVDFRALDTLGEITVLSLAALSAVAVISGVARRRTNRPSEHVALDREEER